MCSMSASTTDSSAGCSTSISYAGSSTTSTPVRIRRASLASASSLPSNWSQKFQVSPSQSLCSVNFTNRMSVMSCPLLSVVGQRRLRRRVQVLAIICQPHLARLVPAGKPDVGGELGRRHGNTPPHLDPVRRREHPAEPLGLDRVAAPPPVTPGQPTGGQSVGGAPRTALPFGPAVRELPRTAQADARNTHLAPSLRPAARE